MQTIACGFRLLKRMARYLTLSFDVATGHAALFQILLVIVLGGIERDRGDDLRGNWFGVTMRFFERFFRGLRLGLLLRRVVEDGGAVLRAPVRALAVELRGVVILPENFQQVGVANLRGIEFHFYRLGVAGTIG